MSLKIGRIEKYYEQTIAEKGAMLFYLIDPDKVNLENAARSAVIGEENGADVLLVGGTIGAQGSILDETVKMIKEKTSIPTVLFPGNISGVTKYADAVYFMQMLNSRDVYWLSTAQIQGAPAVAKLGLEVIPTTYLILEPGRAVGWVGNANVIPRDRPDLAAACALAGKYIGTHVILMDCGSGAPEPAPIPIVSAAAKACAGEVLYFVGGGIRKPEQAEAIIAAGANGIQIGTAFEDLESAARKTKILSNAVHGAGKKRV